MKINSLQRFYHPKCPPCLNSDSEQVVIAQNEDGQLKYKSGSLEDPYINNEVCQILEGGKFAFEKRERKYRIN